MATRIVVFDVFTAAEDTWNSFFEHVEEVRRETSPADALAPRKTRKEKLISDASNPYFKTHRFLMFPENDTRAAAGYAAVSLETPQSPTYQANKHTGTLILSISKNQRGKGLGAELLKHVIAEAKTIQPDLDEFVVPAMLASGWRFLERLGGTVSIESAENRLYLKDVDWTMVTAWAVEGVRRNQGTVLKTVQAIPEEDINDYCAAYTETFNQAPTGDLAIKNQYTPEMIRFAEQKNAGQDLIQITIYSKEPDGKVSGLTETYYQKELKQQVVQCLTGVRRTYTGRGLGKMLKANMLLYIRREYPEAQYIATSNADSNAPMLHINQRLGFKKHLPIKVYKLKI